jgi:DNA-binding transcriptional ArsR family regulator
MARAATTSDAFNAIAEPQRRLIIDLLARGEMPVSAIVEALQTKQPLVSKHLRVLREVGLVTVRTDGRQRLYTLNSEALRPIHDWITPYEHYWSESHDRLEALIEQAKRNSGTNQQ